MRLAVGFVLLFVMGLYAHNSFAGDNCSEVTVNGVMQRTVINEHNFFSQVFAAELSNKSDEQVDQELSHQGSMTWAGVVFGGTFNKSDIKRYVQEMRTKLDISTVDIHESSVILASGDPGILKAWSDCMKNRGGFSLRFEVQSPKEALLILEWYAYPVAPGVSTDTKLNESISIPDGITVDQGKDCITKGHTFRDKVPCTVKLNFDSAAHDLLIAGNVVHGTADAYLPPRQILISNRKPWTPQPGEVSTVQAFAFADDTRSKLICLGPPKGWSFVAASLVVTPQFVSGNSSHSRCKAEMQSPSPTYVCFNARMQPDVSGDNRCNAELHGEVIEWELVDGMGLK